MKFTELPLNSEFEYQGEKMLKTGPLVATCLSSGQQKFMPRSAMVVTQQGHQNRQPGDKLSPRQIPRATVEAAFDTFYQACLQNLDSLQGQATDSLLEDIRKDLEKARQQFLHKL